MSDAPHSSRPDAGEGTCIFCGLTGEPDGPGNLILHRGRLAYVIMNKFPYSNGHLMVVPFRHVKDIEELNADEGGEIFLLAQRCVASLRAGLKAQGFNLGFNLGRPAGAGIDDHLHLHVVPRWEGDHNFMPVLGEVRVIPEHMAQTYAALHEAFEAPD